MNDSPKRVPSLDGLRAISITLVLAAHLAGTPHFPISYDALHYLEIGELGVRVFFVISGFLITSLLLREFAMRGRISLRRFYFRRTFRIFPPYYAFLSVLTLLVLSGAIHLNAGDTLHAFTYTSNYHHTRSWYVGHTWSLAVEEQFYLLWPATLVIAGRRRGLWVAGAVILLSPMVRLGLWYFHPAGRAFMGETFETVSDAIAAGCLLAGVREWLWRHVAYRRLLESPWFFLVPVAVLVATRVSFLIGMTVMNLGIALCIDWCITYHRGRIGRLLNARPFVFVGVMSYSMYLWQQLFLDRYSASVLTQFPLNVVLASLAALISYYLIERPSLVVRERLEARLFVRRDGRAPRGARSVEVAPADSPRRGDGLTSIVRPT